MNGKILRWGYEIRDAVKQALDVRRKPNRIRIVSLNVKDVLLDGKQTQTLRKKLALLLSLGTLVTIILGNSPYRFDYRIKNIMTKDILSVNPGQPVNDIIKMMEGKKIRRLPVMYNGKVVGIVSQTDLIKRLSEIQKAKSGKNE